MVRSQTRVGAGDSLKLAHAALMVLALLAALLAPAPAPALASYYPAPNPGDSYNRATTFAAVPGSFGTLQWESPEAFTHAADGSLWAVQNDANA